MQPNAPYQGPQPYAGPTPSPYAAPAPPPALYRQNFAPYGASAGPLVGSTLRKTKLALGIAHLTAFFAGIALFVAGVMLGPEGDGQVFFAGGGVLLGVFYLLLFAYAVVNVVWLHKFWSWIPPEQRYTSMWKKYISPGTAVGFMFIPYFNIYWMFVVYLGIADIMERLRVQYPTSKPPAKNIALITLIVPMVFFPAAPFLQYLFAKHVEEMAAEMHARMYPGGPAV